MTVIRMKIKIITLQNTTASPLFMCRKKFGVVRQKALLMADVLAQMEPDATFDASELALRLTLDVIGLVSAKP